MTVQNVSMTYNPDTHHRRSVRLKQYDYSKNGAYFITVLTRNRECLFGRICDGAMVLNDIGLMVQRVWNEMPEFYEGIAVDAFQIMPNHIHGIIMIVRAGPRARPETGQPQGAALTVPDVVHRFKTLTTKRYTDGAKQHHWPLFYKSLWHRNYYEHIIRDEESLGRIREYVVHNPMNWVSDEYMKIV